MSVGWAQAALSREPERIVTSAFAGQSWGLLYHPSTFTPAHQDSQGCWIYRSRIIAGVMGMLYDVYITYIHRFLAPELLTIHWLRCYAQYIVGSRRTCYHLLVQAFMGTSKSWGSDIICM